MSDNNSSSGGGCCGCGGWVFGLIMTLLIMAFGGCTETMKFEDPSTDPPMIVVAEPYGIFNEKDKRVDGVVYELSVGHLVWSVILCETLVAPAYFIGWNLYQPVEYIPPRKPQYDTDTDK